jgi:arabinofuranosyltransferase
VKKPLVFLVCLALFLALAWRFFDHTVDDAFISYRYARNLAEGRGLVWNTGQRVEGYTDFLWVVTLAGAIAAGLDAELTSKLLGLAAGAGTLALVVRAAPRPTSRPELVWLAPVLLAVSPPFAAWATGGLETALFALLVTATVLVALPAAEGGALSPGSGLLAAGAALTRPEGTGVALLVAGLLAALRRVRARELVRFGLVFLALFAPYFVWRWSYYGDLLPNTFYAKVGWSGAQLVRGLRYVDGYLRETGYWILMPCLGLLFSRQRARAILLGGAALGYTAYVVGVGGDGLPMYRFLVPVLPLWFLLVADGAEAALDRIGARRGLRAAAALFGVALCAGSAWPAFQGPSAHYLAQDRREVGAWKEIGLWFAAHARETDSIAVIPAGAIPYFSRLRALDMLGMNDRTIAHSPARDVGQGQAGHEKYDVDYVLAQKPTYIVIGVYGLSPAAVPPQQLVRPDYPAERGLLQSPGLAASYELRLGHAESGWFPYFERHAP